MDRGRLVVGIGNALHGADAFGPAVIERLRARSDVPGDVALLDARTDLLACLDSFADFHQVIVVDAFVGGAASGEVVVVDEGTFSQWDRESPDSHAVSAVLAIALFRRLVPTAGTTIALVGLDAADAVASHPVRADQVDAGVATVMQLLQDGA